MIWTAVLFCCKFSKMWTNLLLLLSLGVCCRVLAIDYEMVIDDPDIFSDCREAPPGAGNIESLFDLGELQLSMEGSTVHVEGNATVAWDIQPNDRISASAHLMQLDRGVWQPTVFSIASQDFCNIMYDTDQYWYKYWTRFVKDSSDTKQHCLNEKGAKLVHDPFDLQMVFYNIRGTSLRGRYKLVLTMEAFDDTNNVKRPNSICIEIIGDFSQL